MFRSSVIVLAGLATSVAVAQPGDPIDWRAEEAGILKNQTQLTFAEDWSRAGEAYFSPDGKWIIFQAVPTTEPDSDAPYQMYVAPLVRDENGSVTGLGETIQVSPDGSANTCGYFHPQIPHKVIFGSTIITPQPATDKYSRGKSRYKWVFPDEMEVVTRSIPEIWDANHVGADPRPERSWAIDGAQPVTIWEEPGYDAECSYSPDGRFIVYTHVDPATSNADLYIYDVQTQERWPIVQAPGYDGGPFFSPDGKRLCYRSDRHDNDLLQLFVADLTFDAEGRPVGVFMEHEITANSDVNWAPYFHPSGEFLVFASSAHGHYNYEVLAIETPPVGDAVAPDALATKRITHAMGFDGLPVFSADGSLMMWTSQRSEDKTSQIWIADTAQVQP